MVSKDLNMQFVKVSSNLNNLNNGYVLNLIIREHIHISKIVFCKKVSDVGTFCIVQWELIESYILFNSICFNFSFIQMTNY